MLVRYHEGTVGSESEAAKMISTVYKYISVGAIYGITAATEPEINITKEARELYKDYKGVRLSLAHAVVVKQLYGRMLVGLFIRFDKPIVPTKIFNDF